MLAAAGTLPDPGRLALAPAPNLSTLMGMVDSGTWLSLAPSARVLGVSEKTARRRAKAG
jgi:hypothetical protein